MTNKLDSFGDRHLTLARTPQRDAFWFRLSHAADHSVIWFVLALVRFAFVREIKELIYFVVVMALESGLTNGPIKYCFRRTRPHEQENTYKSGEKLPYGLRRPITSSFPSGHATAAMCACVLLSSSYPLAAIVLFPLGLAVAYSRMYTRMHHLTDVIGGLILGLAFGYIALRFAHVFI